MPHRPEARESIYTTSLPSSITGTYLAIQVISLLILLALTWIRIVERLLFASTDDGIRCVRTLVQISYTARWDRWPPGHRFVPLGCGLVVNSALTRQSNLLIGSHTMWAERAVLCSTRKVLANLPPVSCSEDKQDTKRYETRSTIRVRTVPMLVRIYRWEMRNSLWVFVHRGRPNWLFYNIPTMGNWMY